MDSVAMSLRHTITLLSSSLSKGRALQSLGAEALLDAKINSTTISCSRVAAHVWDPRGHLSATVIEEGRSANTTALSSHLSRRVSFIRSELCVPGMSSTRSKH
jgi:hypothetical protein